MEGSKTLNEIQTPWATANERLLSHFGVNPAKGLSSPDVVQARQKYGINKLREFKTVSWWVVLATQFKSLIVLLLLAATVVSFAVGDYVEGIAVIVVILVNAGIGFGTELKAVRSMEALQKMGGVTANVRRDNTIQSVPAQDLVPGDILLLEGGDRITADARLLQTSKLQADESVLTGESLPISKMDNVLEETTSLPERKNMVFKGTSITRGSAEAIVVATGMSTELGQITSLVQEAKQEETPLEERLNRLANRLIWATAAIVVLVVVAGLVSGRPLILMTKTAIALAIAAIPEGLPIVATIALARGMHRMAKRNALINRLSAVETLGSTNVICTDKTGTLTENRMDVTKVGIRSQKENENANIPGWTVAIKDKENVWQYKDAVREALRIAVLCNNASLGGVGTTSDQQKLVGDPLETALLSAGASVDLHRNQLVQQMPETAEVAFESETKMMATIHRDGDGFLYAVKGAPEEVLQACTRSWTPQGTIDFTQSESLAWKNQNEKMAEAGLRVIGVASKISNRKDDSAYQDLTMVGLIGLWDPPRDDVPRAIRICREAGIQIVMVTGDHAITARNIGFAVGLVDNQNVEVLGGDDLEKIPTMDDSQRRILAATSIFARVSPKQKLNLIELHQDLGSVVAMTGDGVNDAPALKKADIGIAMGERGTEVAREAAAMVLTDDSFCSIVSAVSYGRVIANNIRKFVCYLLSCNISEILIVSLAAIMSVPMPLLPLQILFLNLVTDVFPALALGVGEGDDGIMRQGPRPPREPIVTKLHWFVIGGYSFVMTIAVLGALFLALYWLKLPERQAVTVSFLTLAFAQLWHVFNMRDRGSKVFANSITRNPYIWGALVLCTGLTLLTVFVPFMADVLQVANPGLSGWALIIGMSLLPLILGPLAKLPIPKSKPVLPSQSDAGQTTC